LATLLQSADGLHIHGIWQEHCAISGALARLNGKPYIVSAHGMLERWAVRHKWLKKCLYSGLIERSNLRRAACLHALTIAELEDYRRYGLRNPVAVIPNGVDIPQGASPDMFLQAYPQLKDKRLVVFLSRIHYKKGLDILCKAWHGLRRRFADTHLVIAGPDSDNSQSTVQAYVDALGVSDSVIFTGMLRDAMKWSALAAAELFVLPSYSEGFSVAVLEAMGMALPVVISGPCNFPEVEHRCCGVVIHPTASELEHALSQLLNANCSDRVRMGERGRQLVAEHYSWSAVGRQMAELYQWVVGRPESLTLQVFQ
jgi:glycosyltransferase involved in cell wall biosynthesis